MTESRVIDPCSMLTYCLGGIVKNTSGVIYKMSSIGLELQLHVDIDREHDPHDLKMRVRFVLANRGDLQTFDSLRAVLTHLFPGERVTRCVLDNLQLNRLNLHVDRKPDFIAAIDLQNDNGEDPVVLGFFPTLGAGFHFLGAVQHIETKDLIPG
jgi:hypothetical protein